MIAVSALEHRPGLTYVLASSVVATVVFAMTRDALLGASILVLGAVWFLLRPHRDPPVLALALTFQWVQVTIGLMYFHATGRAVDAIFRSQYRPMMMIGLGCILALAFGVALGRHLTERSDKDAHYVLDEVPIGWQRLGVLYVAAFFMEWTLRDFAFNYPAVTQAILALSFARLGLLFLIIRRLCQPPVRWMLILVVMSIEIGIGLTGYFAGFREPLVMAVIALGELFNARRMQHWVALAVTVIVGSTVGIGWMTVRGTYREEIASEVLQTRTQRLSRMFDLSQELQDLDEYGRMIAVDIFVDRMWPIYYPALAVERVPAILPHTGGELIGGAIMHAVQPRILFPNKPALISDSERVREYAGVQVASVEEDTSIAFGYAAESYIDFGVPLMFVPVFAWGLFMGAAYGWLLGRMRCREFGQALVAVIFWISLYLFERAWSKWIGTSGTLLIYLGSLGLLVDRYLARMKPAAAAWVNWPPAPALPADAETEPPAGADRRHAS